MARTLDEVKALSVGELTYVIAKHVMRGTLASWLEGAYKWGVVQQLIDDFQIDRIEIHFLAESWAVWVARDGVIYNATDAALGRAIGYIALMVAGECERPPLIW